MEFAFNGYCRVGFYSRGASYRGYYLSSRFCLSVCLSVCLTSRCSTETAKRRIMQAAPHDSTRTLVFSAKLKRGHPQRRRQMQVGKLNTDAVAENWRLSTRNIVNLAQSQVYHTECPPYLFAACSP